MNFRQIIRDYFTFGRNERKGIIILLVIIFLLAIANKFIFYFETPATIDKEFFNAAKNDLGTLNDSLAKTEIKKSLFAFDPNVIDSLALDSLNLPWQVKQNLIKYRRKGGKLRSADDFKKIYGVSEQVLQTIEPYLLFPDKSEKVYSEDLKVGQEDESGGISKPLATSYTYQSEKPINHFEKIELNTADSILLKELPGIGEKLSKRIVKYRDILGGFYSVDQLSEVYGLEKTTIQRIAKSVTIDSTRIKKLDVNFSDQFELSRHPYIQSSLAKKIIRYRTKYGSIQDVRILRDSMILNMQEYSRLRPYL